MASGLNVGEMETGTVISFRDPWAAAPDLNVAFKEEEDRDAGRNFMGLAERPDEG